MKKLQFILSSFFILLVISSCNKESRGVNFKPSLYRIGASGGEIITSTANMPFSIHGSSEPMYSVDAPKPHYFYANEDGTFLEGDFFTAEMTEDSRIKINVQPNSTGKNRERYIDVESGDDFGFVTFIQSAD